MLYSEKLKKSTLSNFNRTCSSIIYFGDNNKQFKHDNNIYIYNIDKDEWSKVETKIITPIDKASVCVYNNDDNNIYLIGGLFDTHIYSINIGYLLRPNTKKIKDSINTTYTQNLESLGMKALEMEETKQEKEFNDTLEQEIFKVLEMSS